MEQLLATKLYIPSTRPEFIPRPRLVEQLNQGLHRKLTLVSAPAGFGKTTLIADWLQEIDLPAAWLSLDERDNDPVQFWMYFVTALQAVQKNLGETVLPFFQSPKPPPIETLLTELINQLASLTDQMILVLDDYHTINNQTIHQGLGFLLDHLPHQLCLVILSRSDPPLPLARLRAGVELVELREPDLRFTLEEAKALLHLVTRLDLDHAAVTTLESRT